MPPPAPGAPPGPPTDAVAPPAPPTEAVPPSNIASSTASDPHNFGPAATEISSSTQKRAKAAVVAAATALEDGEIVQAMVCGEYRAHDGVAVLTDRRVILANSRTFAPEIDSIPIGEVADIKGWADSGRATLRVSSSSTSLVIGDIKEVDGAQNFAAAVRSRI